MIRKSITCRPGHDAGAHAVTMNPTVPLVDFAPFVRLALLALVVALLPLSWVWLRQRDTDSRRRLAALTALTLFLTFDLIVFGSFTRLTDSGLGCPDWPGCYGEASPFGAHADIHAAQTQMPTGPVTFTKAWIEMIHRYVAMTVGVLILAMAAFSWRERLKSRHTLPLSPWWPTLTLVWVVVQGLFGKYTVTLKLYPAIVTLHLLGGLVLLSLLAFQHEAFGGRPIALAPRLRRATLGVAALLVLQITLGGWVSTNYAVLACTGFPTCNGRWWPPMEFAEGFSVLRHLGQTGSGTLLSMPSLVGIHMAHRIVAVFAATALLVLAWRLRRSGAAAAARFGAGLAVLTLLQVATGLSNVELNWPIVAALMHSGGAAALVLLMALLLARSAPGAHGAFSRRRAAAP